MTDIISLALEQQEDQPGHMEKTWFVAFDNNETRRGKIGILGDGNYVLMNDGTPYFFHVSKVIYLYPRT